MGGRDIGFVFAINAIDKRELNQAGPFFSTKPIEEACAFPQMGNSSRLCVDVFESREAQPKQDDEQ
ncbi:MAG: hypothetical protein ACRDBX_02380 [Erysipelotrichaceae bacterium]